jgi:DeoR/GlpR family transcriptional regulator of sugar metabolism
VGHHSEAKTALGTAAAALVAEGESVFLDSSSSAYHAARAILDRGIRATLITNSQPIMELVAAHPGAEPDLIGIGGSLRRLTRSFVGPVATGAVQAHVADRLFFSVKGLSRKGVLMDADPLEAEVKRSMMRHADEVVLLIDHSKLEARGLSVIGGLEDVDGVLGAGLDPEHRGWLAGTGVRLELVGPAGADGSGR